MIKSPYLIQRAEIVTPLAPKTTILSNAVSLHYMGSAEFEFGALPKSLRRMQADLSKLVLRKVPEIMDGEACLHVLSFMSDEEFEEYKEYLCMMRDPFHTNKIRTKESHRFNSDYVGKYEKSDFWWDIRNDLMFGFNEMFMNRCIDYVKSSLAHMDILKNYF